MSFLVKQAHAAITNPAIGELGDDLEGAKGGELFTDYFIRVWNGVITFGALMLVIMFLWGAIGWITAGGDAGKVQKSRDRMVQGVIGLIVLVGSYTLIAFISTVFFGEDFNILNLQLAP